MIIRWNGRSYDTDDDSHMADLQKELKSLEAIVEHYIKKQTPALLRNYGGTA